ncbi:PDZ domain-containing protein [Frankia sp. AgKG'84/4]
MRSPLRTTRTSVLTAAALAVAVPVGVGLSAGLAQAATPDAPTPTTCGPIGAAPVPGQPGTALGPLSAPAVSTPTLAPVTEATLRQTYYCLSDHYYGANPRTDRVLLVGAYAGVLSELDHLGQQRVAAPAAFAGDRDVDWNAFRAVLQRAGQGPGDTTAVRQRLGIAALNGMSASVRDEQAPSTYTEVLAGHAPKGLTVSAPGGPGVPAPPAPAGAVVGGGPDARPANVVVGDGSVAVAQSGPRIVIGPASGASGPEFGESSAGGAQRVLGFQVSKPRDGAATKLTLAEVKGGPAEAAGLRAGDVIESIDGHAPISKGRPVREVIDRLLPPRSGSRAVRLVVHRPSTGRTWTVNLTQQAPDPAAGGGPRVHRFRNPDGPGHAAAHQFSLREQVAPKPAVAAG